MSDLKTEVLKNGKCVKIHQNQNRKIQSDGLDGRILNLALSLNKEQFISFFNSIDFNRKIDWIDSMCGFSSQIMYLKRKNKNEHLMFATLIKKGAILDQSKVFREDSYNYCLSYAQDWIVKTFLEKIEISELYLRFSISDKPLSKENGNNSQELDVLKKENKKLQKEATTLNEKNEEQRKFYEQKLKACQIENKTKIEKLQKEFNEKEKKNLEIIENYKFFLKSYDKDTENLMNLSQEEIEKLQNEFELLSKNDPSFMFFDEHGKPLHYVEDVIAYKKVKGKEFYQVLWLGYQEPTWEPKEGLTNIDEEILKRARKNEISFPEEKNLSKRKKVKTN